MRKKRVAAWVGSIAVTLFLLLNIAATRFTTAGAVVGAALWVFVWVMLVTNYRRSRVNFERQQYAISEWQRVAEHWRERYREHFAEAHPDVPIPPLMIFAGMPRCTLDHQHDDDGTDGAQ